MIPITPAHLAQLAAIEAHVHYAEPPPPGVERPFVVVERPAAVLFSAPHGARCLRAGEGEEWHEEDEYTAAMALLLAELCGTPAIATVWRSDESDPNSTPVNACPYKREVRRLVETLGVRWVLDLHGLRHGRLAPGQLVDLGTRGELRSMPEEQLARLVELLEAHLGPGVVSHNAYPARSAERRITGYCHGILGVHAVQIEMGPAVRTVFRRVDGSAYRRFGPFAAEPGPVLGMMQALAGFVAYLGGLAPGPGEPRVSDSAAPRAGGGGRSKA